MHGKRLALVLGHIMLSPSPSGFLCQLRAFVLGGLWGLPPTAVFCLLSVLFPSLCPMYTVVPDLDVTCTAGQSVV